MYTMVNEDVINLASVSEPCEVLLHTSREFNGKRFTKEMFMHDLPEEYFDELLERGFILKLFMNFDLLEEVSPEGLTIAQKAAVEEMIEEALVQQQQAA